MTIVSVQVSAFTGIAPCQAILSCYDECSARYIEVPSELAGKMMIVTQGVGCAKLEGSYWRPGGGADQFILTYH